MKNKNLFKNILLVVALSLGIAPFNGAIIAASVQVEERKRQQSKFKQFYAKLSDIASVPYRDAKIIWEWLQKIFTLEDISPELQAKASKALLRTGLPVAIILFTAVGVLEYRLKRGIKLSAFEHAWILNDINEVKRLIKNANLNVRDSSGLTFLDRAILYRPDWIELVLENGANINSEIPASSSLYPGKTPLMLAAERNDIKLMQLLVAKGADVNYKNKQGRTVLSDIIEDNYASDAVIQFLLNAGATPYEKKYRGGAERKEYSWQYKRGRITITEENIKTALGLEKAKNDFSWYEILGVKDDASKLEIKKAYVKLMLKHAPDKNAGSLLSEEVTKYLNKAKEMAG